jgi:EAL domain-containing protein (putative c-di-GMP-specific phosphodiesterase class I)
MSPMEPITVDELAEAISQDRLSLVYQPQMTADGRTMIGVEALVRWHDPRRGAIDPSVFIPLAEKSGLVMELGAWALRRACHDGADWHPLIVGVNVSPVQFNDKEFVALVETIAKEAGMPLERLELEITESAYFGDPVRAVEEVASLRALGIRVALDDFGTGYASLTYLRRLPLTKIKIDQSFVREIDRIDSAAIIHAVVALARALGLKVTAEGVETREQQRFLQAAGCHYLQGYLFSQPVKAEEIADALTRAG